MGRPRTFDMGEAIATATRLFWRKGYDRTSLADLTGALGIAAASFYFAFGSKERLFRLIIEQYIAIQVDAFERAFDGRGARAGVRELLRGYVDVVTGSGHAPGCLVINNAPSADAADPLKQWLAEYREALRSRLEGRFSSEAARGALPAGFEPRAMACFVVTVAGGLALEAQSGARREELYSVIDIALGRIPDAVGASRAADGDEEPAPTPHPAPERLGRRRRPDRTTRAKATVHP